MIPAFVIGAMVGYGEGYRRGRAAGLKVGALHAARLILGADAASRLQGMFGAILRATKEPPPTE